MAILIPASRRAFLHALGALAAWAMGGASASRAQDLSSSEYQIKAAFLINFPKYAEWPAAAFAGTDSPVVIVVPGETKVIAELQKVIKGRSINGREITLKRVPAGEAPGACHILFVPLAEQPHFQALLLRIKDNGVLTVGESDSFLEQGGIINLALRDRKITLEVNLTAAEHAGIKISSKLLTLASLVKGRTK